MGFLDKFTKKNKKIWFGLNKPQVKVEKEIKIKEEKKEEKKKEENKTKKNLSHSNAHKVLVHPLVSEKAAVAEANSVYTFVVNRKATKDAVRQAIKDVYGVSPDRVRMINVEGKIARHGRSVGRRGDWRKALVTLRKGQTISTHEGV
ncbi:MAG: 50S ribosomal protein L23 [Candidatus Magasanikbacteria bacterium]|nr:50S ribosomal protein L23 [Candidatus Magasanikbacteria bacterium]